ncbi:MAG TPA: CPBP family intramembrane glutamic endopeptidase [Symbiobacteriaceae bacterium]|nr:CPBP family intramembrane glutamic endopeptidase [Symbiobacteriaceae bacterium]
MVLISRGVLPAFVPVDALWVVGVIGPICAAILVAYAEAGAPGVRGLLSRLLLWRVGARWYLVAILARALPMLVAAAVSGAVLPFTFRPWVWLTSALLFLGGAVCEETGWRGWALPALQKRFSPWVASVALGIIWAAWHLPQFLTVGDEHANRSFSLFLINMVAFTILMTWVNNRTNGSILMAVIFHGIGFNLALTVIPFDPYHPVVMGLAWAMALAVIVTETRTPRRATT